LARAATGGTYENYHCTLTERFCGLT